MAPVARRNGVFPNPFGLRRHRPQELGAGFVRVGIIERQPTTRLAGLVQENHQPAVVPEDPGGDRNSLRSDGSDPVWPGDSGRSEVQLFFVRMRSPAHPIRLTIRFRPWRHPRNGFAFPTPRQYTMRAHARCTAASGCQISVSDCRAAGMRYVARLGPTAAPHNRKIRTKTMIERFPTASGRSDLRHFDHGRAAQKGRHPGGKRGTRGRRRPRG